jgi:hypothetical protein
MNWRYIKKIAKLGNAGLKKNTVEALELAIHKKIAKLGNAGLTRNRARNTRC